MFAENKGNIRFAWELHWLPEYTTLNLNLTSRWQPSSEFLTVKYQLLDNKAGHNTKNEAKVTLLLAIVITMAPVDK